MNVMPNKTYEVSGQIRIQDGSKTTIRRFKKRDYEHNGPVDDPKVYTEILDDFITEVVEEKEQTTLPSDEKKPAEKPAKK